LAAPISKLLKLPLIKEFIYIKSPQQLIPPVEVIPQALWTLVLISLKLLIGGVNSQYKLLPQQLIPPVEVIPQAQPQTVLNNNQFACALLEYIKNKLINKTNFLIILIFFNKNKFCPISTHTKTNHTQKNRK